MKLKTQLNGVELQPYLCFCCISILQLMYCDNTRNTHVHYALRQCADYAHASYAGAVEARVARVTFAV